MVSSFGNMFVGRPREAETTDARLGIRRHDPDYERRQQKKREGNDISAFDDQDRASVSVEALYVFLESLLRSQDFSSIKENKKSQIYQENQYINKNIPTGISNSPSAAAAMAYQHGAQTSRRQSFVTSQVEESNISSGPQLSALDIRKIHDLLPRLKALSARGIMILNIERAETFLASLINAIDKIDN